MEDDDGPRSPSPCPSLSPSPSSSRSPSPSPPVPVSTAPPVTLVTPPAQTLTLALPIQQPRPSSGGGFAGREDCWSEGATSVLIDAWGERYLELSRGNLRQKHWQEVADAVTSREGYTKAPKTDVQCKNRIDTLKKKYKVEKSKPNTSWPFFHRLDLLLGANQNNSKSNPNPSPPVHIRPPSLPQFPQRQRSGHPVSAKRPRSPPSISSKSDPESSDGFPPEPVINGKNKKRGLEEEEIEREKRRIEGVKALTKAILKFGEVYERMETSRLQQEMELEKHRMAFARELELQRMQFFVKTQMELSQLERTGVGADRRGRMGDVGTSNNLNNSGDSSNSGSSG